MADRRSSHRIALFLEIQEIDRQPRDDTYLLDLSETGARIETPIQYSPGDRIEFIFYLPDKVTAMYRKGQVAWVTPHDAKPGSFLVGLDLADEWELGRRTASPGQTTDH